MKTPPPIQGGVINGIRTSIVIEGGNWFKISNRVDGKPISNGVKESKILDKSYPKELKVFSKFIKRPSLLDENGIPLPLKQHCLDYVKTYEVVGKEWYEVHTPHNSSDGGARITQTIDKRYK